MFTAFIHNIMFINQHDCRKAILHISSIDAVCDVPTHTSKMLEQELNYTYTIQNTTSSTKHLPQLHTVFFSQRTDDEPLVLTTDIRIMLLFSQKIENCWRPLVILQYSWYCVTCGRHSVYRFHANFWFDPFITNPT